MKKFLFNLVLVLITSFVISACADEPIQPADGGKDDPCQITGTGCPK